MICVCVLLQRCTKQEAILKRGEERTAADNEKVKQQFQDVKTFDFDKAFSDTAPFVDRDAPIGKQAELVDPTTTGTGLDFIDLGKRERKKAVNVDSEYWRNVLKQNSATNKKPKGVFRPNFRPDFQFFDNDALIALEQKEFESRYKMKILRDADKVRDARDTTRCEARLSTDRVLFCSVLLYWAVRCFVSGSREGGATAKGGGSARGETQTETKGRRSRCNKH